MVSVIEGFHCSFCKQGPAALVTAGTVMAVPVREKNGVAWILSRVASPSVRRSLGRLTYDEAFSGHFLVFKHPK